MKVERIKERVEEKEGIPPQQQRLIYSGKQMWVPLHGQHFCSVVAARCSLSSISFSHSGTMRRLLQTTRSRAAPCSTLCWRYEAARGRAGQTHAAPCCHESLLGPAECRDLKSHAPWPSQRKKQQKLRKKGRSNSFCRCFFCKPTVSFWVDAGPHANWDTLWSICLWINTEIEWSFVLQHTNAHKMLLRILKSEFWFI